jgi:hypothetical protein
MRRITTCNNNNLYYFKMNILYKINILFKINFDTIKIE